MGTAVVNEWRKEDENTDFNLAILNSSNLDYTSWMNNVDGSYLIFNFCKKANECLDAAKDVVLSDIFYEIQNELAHDKQLPVYSWNNDTRNIKFVKESKKQVLVNDADSAGTEVVTEDDDIVTEGIVTTTVPQGMTNSHQFIRPNDVTSVVNCKHL